MKNTRVAELADLNSSFSSESSWFHGFVTAKLTEWPGHSGKQTCHRFDRKQTILVCFLLGQHNEVLKYCKEMHSQNRICRIYAP